VAVAADVPAVVVVAVAAIAGANPAGS
jgi:hypothetical protein